MDHIMVMVPVIIMIVTMIDSDWIVRVQVTGKEISEDQQLLTWTLLDRSQHLDVTVHLGPSRSDPD